MLLIIIKSIPPPRNLAEVFLVNGNKYKDSTALIYKPGHRYERLTYSELQHEIIKTSVLLKELGIRSKDHVLILSENRPEWVILDAALMLVGAVSVPIHVSTSKSYVECIIEETNPASIFISNIEVLTKAEICIDRFSTIVSFERVGTEKIQKLVVLAI